MLHALCDFLSDPFFFFEPMGGMKFLPPAFSNFVNDKKIDQRRITGFSFASILKKT